MTKLNVTIESQLPTGSKAWEKLNHQSFPFQDKLFLSALINSQSIHPDTGQSAFFINVYSDDQLVGCMPCYLKEHSYGEYLFDWQWANHFQMNSIPYYPKLVAYTPFSPIIGPKFLCQDQQVRETLLHAFIGLAKELQCFSASILFPTADEANYLAAQTHYQMKKRINYQYNWQNENYQQFDQFLELLKKSKRKNIKKERQVLAASQIEIQAVSQPELKNYAETFYPFYLNTIDKKYAHPYLTQEFFHEIFNQMPQNILLIQAKQEGEVIANALSMVNQDEVFGRYWGANKEVPNLHFELCYYQNIVYAIEHNLRRVQAGAQGLHKIPRGYLPEEVCSFHFFLHPKVNESIQNYIVEENAHTHKQYQELMALSPYKSN